MYDENSNATAASATLVALNAAAAAATSSATGTAPIAPTVAPVNSSHLVSQLMNTKDSRWLQLEVCREFQRGQCSRSDVECKFAHPPAHVDVQNGRVTACYDSIKVCAFFCFGIHGEVIRFPLRPQSVTDFLPLQ